MTTKKIMKKMKKQRGIALLIAIFALLLVTGIALAMMSATDTETNVERNYRDSQKAYFAALAGIQEARVRLTLTDATAANTGGTAGVIPNTTTSGMPNLLDRTGIVYIVNPKNGETVDPGTGTYIDNELCNESFTGLSLTATGLNVPCATLPTGSWYVTKTSTDPNTGTSAALDFKWVRITQKANQSAGGSSAYYISDPLTANNNTPVCWDGAHQRLKDSIYSSCEENGMYTTVYRLASLAQTSSGARRMVIAEVAKNPPINPNASVVSKDNVVLNGKLDVIGMDYCSCDVKNCTFTTLADGSKVASSCPAQSPGKTCNLSKYAIYAQGSVQDPQGKSETVEAGVNPPIADNQTNFIYDIPTLVNKYKQNALNVTGAPYNWSCPSGDCGTRDSVTVGIPPAFPPSPVDNPLPDSNFGSCNTSTTPWTGAGCPSTQITYVPGNLKLTSSAKGNGILIVDGDLDINGGLQFYGLILVKGVVKFTGGGNDTTNIYGAVMAGQESYVDNTLGGSAVIQYNQCAFKNLQQPSPATLLSIREATY
ncbi:MAG: hypothetical protein ACM3JB_11255 [Acidobacteriaceae bacterium]